MMAVRKHTVVLLLVICGLIESAWQLWGESLSADVKNEAALVTGEVPTYHGEGTTGMYDAAERKAAFAQTISPLNSNVYYQRARIAHQRAVDDKSSDRDCEALREVTKAALLSPATAKYQITWALFAQGLSADAACGSARANDGLARLHAANSLAPASAADVYQSAVTLLKYKEREKAFALFQKAQELDPLFSDEQKEFIYDLVTSAEDLAQLMPHRFPQTVTWVSYFSEKRPAELREWNLVFAKALGDTISELDARVHDGRIDQDDFSQYIKQIQDTIVTARTEDLRVRLDKILANLYALDGQTEWSQILTERAEVKRLPVLKGIIPNDKNSELPLFGWHEDTSGEEVGFDRAGQSIGFFVPENMRVERIVLEGRNLGNKERELPLQLFSSSDNRTYHPYRGTFDIKTYTVDQHDEVIISLSETRYQYFKLVYQGTLREPRFVNSFAQLLQVYGKTS